MRIALWKLYHKLHRNQTNEDRGIFIGSVSGKLGKLFGPKRCQEPFFRLEQIEPRFQFGDLHYPHFLKLFWRAMAEFGVGDAAGPAETVEEPVRHKLVAGSLLVAGDPVVQVAGPVDVRRPVVGADQVEPKVEPRQTV